MKLVAILSVLFFSACSDDTTAPKPDAATPTIEASTPKAETSIPTVDASVPKAEASITTIDAAVPVQ